MKETLKELFARAEIINDTFLVSNLDAQKAYMEIFNLLKEVVYLLKDGFEDGKDIVIQDSSELRQPFWKEVFNLYVLIDHNKAIGDNIDFLAYIAFRELIKKLDVLQQNDPEKVTLGNLTIYKPYETLNKHAHAGCVKYDKRMSISYWPE